MHVPLTRRYKGQHDRLENSYFSSTLDVARGLVGSSYEAADLLMYL